MDDQVLMARQPIYDQNTKVIAYELLFRRYGEDSAEITDGDAATSQLLVDAFTEWDIREIVGSSLAFINFTKHLIGNPPPFDRDTMVIEVLEDVPIDAELVAHLKVLSDRGYTIALDDFIYSQIADQILPLVDIVKIDILQLSRDELEEHVTILKPYNLKLLAEKVETPEEFELCKGLGFDMFQGYFLSRPEIISNKQVPASKLAVIELLQQLNDPEINPQNLESIISSDPVLSFKVLKLVNAASYAKVAKIESIDRAINYLGLNILRSFASLLALSNLSDKPSALKDYSCIRAKICEQIGEKVSPGNASSYFSVGLLSTLDAYFDKTLGEIVSLLTLHEDVESALINGTGELGLALRVSARLQEADFDGIDWEFLEKHHISPIQLSQINQNSIIWQQGIRPSSL